MGRLRKPDHKLAKTITIRGGSAIKQAIKEIADEVAIERGLEGEYDMADFIREIVDASPFGDRIKSRVKNFRSSDCNCNQYTA